VPEAKGKEATYQDNYGSSAITYSRRTRFKQMVQTGPTTETLAETAEQIQKMPMTMLEVVPEPELTGKGSGMLGNSAVRLTKIMEKKGAESEGIGGVTEGLRKAREEIILHETQDSFCSSPGVAEIEKLEEQIHDGGETGIAGNYQLVSVLSVGVGEDRDEGDQESESPRKAEINFGLGEIESPNVSKGLKVQEMIGEVAELVECEKELKDYVGCENELREDGEGDNILAMVTRTDDVIGGSGMLDIQPLAVLGEQLGDDPMSTEWVVERVRGFCKVVGMSCSGFEDKLTDLFNDIEAHR
jgi:hypothetical protein